MLHLAKTKMHLFLFSFEFSALEVPHFKIQKSSNFKIYFSYPIIYHPGHNQTYKSRRIVISYGFCITKCFQNWVGLHNLIFQVSFFDVSVLIFIGANRSKIRDDFFGVFSFSSSRFSPEITFYFVLGIFKPKS